MRKLMLAGTASRCSRLARLVARTRSTRRGPTPTTTSATRDAQGSTSATPSHQQHESNVEQRKADETLGSCQLQPSAFSLPADGFRGSIATYRARGGRSPGRRWRGASISCAAPARLLTRRPLAARARAIANAATIGTIAARSAAASVAPPRAVRQMRRRRVRVRVAPDSDAATRASLNAGKHHVVAQHPDARRRTAATPDARAAADTTRATGHTARPTPRRTRSAPFCRAARLVVSSSGPALRQLLDEASRHRLERALARLLRFRRLERALGRRRRQLRSSRGRTATAHRPRWRRRSSLRPRPERASYVA